MLSTLNNYRVKYLFKQIVEQLYVTYKFYKVIISKQNRALDNDVSPTIHNIFCSTRICFSVYQQDIFVFRLWGLYLQINHKMERNSTFRNYPFRFCLSFIVDYSSYDSHVSIFRLVDSNFR